MSENTTNTEWPVCPLCGHTNDSYGFIGRTINPVTWHCERCGKQYMVECRYCYTTRKLTEQEGG